MMNATGTFFLLLAVLALNAGSLSAQNEDGWITVDEIIIASPESQLRSITVVGKYKLPPNDPLQQISFWYSSDGGKTYKEEPVLPSGVFATKYSVTFMLPSGNYQGYALLVLKSGKQSKSDVQFWTVK